MKRSVVVLPTLALLVLTVFVSAPTSALASPHLGEVAHKTKTPNLHAMLLKIGQMPTGWSVDNSTGGSGIERLGSIMKPKGIKQTATATVYFDDNGNTPELSERLATYSGSAHNAFAKIVAALRSCKHVSGTASGTKVTGTVGQMNLKSYGSQSAAFNVKLTGGGATLGEDVLIVRKGQVLMGISEGDFGPPDGEQFQGFVRKALARLSSSAPLLVFGATAYAIATRAASPTGVITAGDSKANCIFIDAVNGVLTAAELSAVEATTGVKYNCIEIFSDEEPQWADWVNPWPTGTPWDGWDAWLAASPGHQLVLTLSLVPESVSPTGYPTNTAWEATCASGAYDQYAVTLAENLVAEGAGNSVIRLGKEFNGDWENDFVGDPSDADYSSELANWISCYQNEVTAMRSVAGAHFLFDWNPNTCTTNIPLAQAYPGNAYVDIIGADFYDTDCWTLKTAAQGGWSELYTIDPSIQDSMSGMVAFAEAQGKPLSIPEWGLEGSDDTAYMKGIISVVENNDVAYQSYLDCNCDGITPLGSAVPASTAVYQHAFG